MIGEKGWGVGIPFDILLLWMWERGGERRPPERGRAVTHVSAETDFQTTFADGSVDLFRNTTMEPPPRSTEAASSAAAPSAAAPSSSSGGGKRPKSPYLARPPPSPALPHAVAGWLTGPASARPRPPWDDTPLRSRPPALMGLLVTTERWARDELVYNRRFNMQCDYDGHFAVESPFAPNRMIMAEIRKEAYLGRVNQKQMQITGTLDMHDGNPFT